MSGYTCSANTPLKSSACIKMDFSVSLDFLGCSRMFQNNFVFCFCVYAHAVPVSVCF